ncbi:MAG: hypothetical protein AYL28_003450 [Candidatus Bathyarchaeota archaeon B23]|nr:MAG: hypothetical protein AYL28_003450 [Candidatus Bathyarchaeota archaeon B23]
MMSNIEFSTEEEHEKIKRQLANYMEKKYSYIVTHMADAAPRYPQPPKIGRHIPDILAEKRVGDEVFRAVGEAKSCVDLDDEEIKEQIQDYVFEKSGYEFFLGVLKRCEGRAKNILKELDVSYSRDKNNHLVAFKINQK